MEHYLPFIIRGAEERTREFLQAQCKDAASFCFGGKETALFEAKPTIYDMATALSVYFSEGSHYYRDPSLWRALLAAMDFVERIQREDGSFDFPACNFFSAADTAFCFKRLVLGYDLLKKYGGKEHEVLQIAYKRVMKKSLPAIRDGGFHTPNHRWAIAAALLQGRQLFYEKDDVFDSDADFDLESLKKRADLYLAEGIDQDRDGQYSERSTGNYNAVVNAALLSIHRLLPDEDYLSYVENNLRMMLTFIEPDGSIFTADSTRQDQNVKRYADRYFYQYLYMAKAGKSEKDRKIFGNAAHAVIRNCFLRGERAPDCLPMLLVYDLKEYSFSMEADFPRHYRKYFSDSRLLRVRKDDFTYTVLGGKNPFLHLQYKSLPLRFRLGISYCEKRSFQSDLIEVDEEAVRLAQRMEGWYYIPFSPKESHSFKKAPKERENVTGAMLLDGREKIINSLLDIRVSVKEIDEGLALTIRTRGLDRLPLRLEISVPAGTFLSHEAFSLRAEADSSLFFKEGCLELSEVDADSSFVKKASLKIGPGFYEHGFTGHYSGEDRFPETYTLFLNAYTPLDKTLEIHLLP